ncbi:discoidin domain-containing receptor 2 isoform X4 [Zootermopsis nevadensis]|uniref:discoidin domain-containing receptor 2 isoform X4 n=1 Tax=Zootermopsis nevadensis TaxID=136037 RepID=UPI000B8E93E9|nr:discoidin domain-containing receptor 2 isoform X4 [Zootermopsis nevadensis]
MTVVAMPTNIATTTTATTTSTTTTTWTLFMVSLYYFVTILLIRDLRCHALELVNCGVPLGLETGAIPDSDITASSAYDFGIVGPQHGRLRHDKNGGAWCPKHMVTREALEYLEVNLHTMHVMTAVQTQGRFGNGMGQEYAEVYMLEYWRPGFNSNTWARWKDRGGKEMIPGNRNTYSVVEQRLDPPVLATKVRVMPFTEHVRTVCMRVELVGCRWHEGLLSYSMPQGVQRGTEVDLSDRTYDGREESGYLSGGLGQLVDGQKGQDIFRLDLKGHGKGYEWVGWRNDTVGMAGHPVEIVFEFDRVRNFSAMYLHTNNLFSKDVQVFSHAKVHFSIGGHQFFGEPVFFSYMPDVIMEHARNVTIKLHNRVGRYVRLQLYFAAKWIMVSEVSFDSVVVSGNFTEEEIEGGILKTDDHGKEYPLQRDEVQTTPSRDDRANSAGAESGDPGGPDSSVSKQYIGLVIGVLTAVILLLMGAIMFIVVRNRRLKSGPGHSVLPAAFGGTQKGVTINMKVSVEDPSEVDKSAVYHEPYNLNMYSAQGGKTQQTKELSQRHPNSPDYTDVPDIVSQEYAVPHISNDGTPPPPFPIAPPATPARTLPPLHNFFPKPPAVPPPPEKYYAATEICKQAAPQPPSPPLSPPPLMVPQLTSVKGTIGSSTFGEAVSPEALTTATDEEDEDEDMPLCHFPREHLRVLEKLGHGEFGEIHLCEVEGFPDSVDVLRHSECKLVAVKSLRPGASQSARSDFQQEARLLARLRDPNIVRVLGASLDDEPLCVVVEYMECGDLNQFLQEHIAETASPLPRNAKTLSYGCLIFMATQISSGMKYLESLNFVHRDLATRNCLVGRGYGIKVSDFGMSRSLYSADYYSMEGRALLPVRWMAWESVLLGKFTTKSDVWSFAVTLWEILTFAREQPFEDLSDEKVVENVTHFYQDDGHQVYLPVPINCPKEIYDLMCECWQRNESDRPNFREIHLFLQRKNLGYKPNTD